MPYWKDILMALWWNDLCCSGQFKVTMKYRFYYFCTTVSLPLLWIKLWALQIYCAVKSSTDKGSGFLALTQGKCQSQLHTVKCGPLPNWLLKIINARLQADFHLNPSHSIVLGQHCCTIKIVHFWINSKTKQSICSSWGGKGNWSPLLSKMPLGLFLVGGGSRGITESKSR